MKKKIFLYITIAIVLVIISVVISVFVLKHDFVYKHETITLNGTSFDTLISDTEALREKGLGQRKSLPDDQAMIFVFDKPDYYSFWMKDMSFPLDMIWVDASSTVIWIEHDVKPETFPKSFYPQSPALYVVEVNTGVSQKIGLNVGDRITISK